MRCEQQVLRFNAVESPHKITNCLAEEPIKSFDKTLKIANL